MTADRGTEESGSGPEPKEGPRTKRTRSSRAAKKRADAPRKPAKAPTGKKPASASRTKAGGGGNAPKKRQAAETSGTRRSKAKSVPGAKAKAKRPAVSKTAARKRRAVAPDLAVRFPPSDKSSTAKKRRAIAPPAKPDIATPIRPRAAPATAQGRSGSAEEVEARKRGPSQSAKKSHKYSNWPTYITNADIGPVMDWIDIVWPNTKRRRSARRAARYALIALTVVLLFTVNELRKVLLAPGFQPSQNWPAFAAVLGAVGFQIAAWIGLFWFSRIAAVLSLLAFGGFVGALYYYSNLSSPLVAIGAAGLLLMFIQGVRGTFAHQRHIRRTRPPKEKKA